MCCAIINPLLNCVHCVSVAKWNLFKLANFFLKIISSLPHSAQFHREWPYAKLWLCLSLENVTVKPRRHKVSQRADDFYSLAFPLVLVSLQLRNGNCYSPDFFLHVPLVADLCRYILPLIFFIVSHAWCWQVPQVFGGFLRFFGRFFRFFGRVVTRCRAKLVHERKDH